VSNESRLSLVSIVTSTIRAPLIVFNATAKMLTEFLWAVCGELLSGLLAVSSFLRDPRLYGLLSESYA
jgi:hypothetical protein